MRERHLDVFAPGVIVHPTLGEYLGTANPVNWPRGSHFRTLAYTRIRRILSGWQRKRYRGRARCTDERAGGLAETLIVGERSWAK